MKLKSFAVMGAIALFATVTTNLAMADDDMNAAPQSFQTADAGAAQNPTLPDAGSSTSTDTAMNNTNMPQTASNDDGSPDTATGDDDY